MIGDIFLLAAVEKDQLRFQLKIDRSSETSDWYIRAHLPIRVSPLGTPILLLSVLDKRQHSESLQREGKLQIGRAKKDLHRIYGHVSQEEKIVIPRWKFPVFFAKSLQQDPPHRVEKERRQKENLPQGKSTSACLSTFIGCLFSDNLRREESSFTTRFNIIGFCCKCWEIFTGLKACGPCKLVTYTALVLLSQVSTGRLGCSSQAVLRQDLINK